ncbi:Pyrophosphate-energised proton pump [Cynara cardunculus var. scolymus]|uniref:H(+)-exporting diphosphatase n=1 Tax=Cynara cardunculus var. scolymus TaxID=59895 RepID=A0A124SER6_CYNCS|nr:Pyrophosphate-energised proton pump [Cynara cardunculus var. scolymus]
MPPYTLCKAVQQFNGKNWKKIGERKHRGIARPKCSYQYDTSYQESFVRPPAAMPTVEIVLCACRESMHKVEILEYVKISTDVSLKEIIPPGALVMITPLVAGTLFGVESLAGVLAGSLVSGVQGG